MDSLKKEIDKNFRPYEFKSGVEELFIRYKKRKARKKAFFMSLTAVCIVFTVLILGESAARVGTNSSNRLGLSVSAFSVDMPIEMNEGKKLIADSGGVLKQVKKVAYDKNGIEILSGKKAYKYGERTVITPAPLTLKISGEDVESYKAECTSNGSLYNEKNNNIKSKRLFYKDNKSVSWIPNCDRLSAMIEKDNIKIPSTSEADERISKKINALLKTEDDYNYFFGDTIKITAKCKDKSVKTISVRITLDDKGRYYISED